MAGCETGRIAAFFVSNEKKPCFQGLNIENPFIKDVIYFGGGEENRTPV